MSDPAALVADRQQAFALCPVSRETEERLDILVEELRRWQRVKNLVGPATLDRVWTRHVADSLQLLDLAPDTARTWVDLGSGAGFPGLVVAIAAMERIPGVMVHLVESNSRKCAFLRHAARLTGAPVVAHEGRIEEEVGRLMSNPGEWLESDRLRAPASPRVRGEGLASLVGGEASPQGGGEGAWTRESHPDAPPHPRSACLAPPAQGPLPARGERRHAAIDVVTARALASLAQLLAWSEPLLTAGAVGLFPKGREVKAELTEAAKSWTYAADLLPSRTDSEGRIVRISSPQARR